MSEDSLDESFLQNAANQGGTSTKPKPRRMENSDDSDDGLSIAEIREKMIQNIQLQRKGNDSSPDSDHDYVPSDNDAEDSPDVDEELNSDGGIS